MKRPKVFLVGPPFSGHLHPLLGIGIGLQSVADVTLLSTPGGVATSEASGLAGRAILGEHEKAIWEIAEPGQHVKANPLLLYRQIKANVALLAGLKRELDAIFRIEKPDLVIADFTVPVAGLAAQQQGLRWWSTLPSPCVFETPDGPPAYFGGLRPATNALKHVQHALGRVATRFFKRSMWWLFQRSLVELGFPGIYRADGSERVYSPDRILALGVPEIEFPRCYPPHFHWMGPVLFTPPEHRPAPAFADDGRPHVLVTLGTHLPHAKAHLAKVIGEIASRHPQVVFHFSHGKAGADKYRAEGNFHEYAFISYTSHLPKYDLIVHHAGAGVLHHALSQGKPSVVHPLDFDQFDNAARLVSAGLALQARKPADLEPSILRALRDKPLHDRCHQMSAVLRRYDAVGDITRWVSELSVGAP